MFICFSSQYLPLGGRRTSGRPTRWPRAPMNTTTTTTTNNNNNQYQYY